MFERRKSRVMLAAVLSVVLVLSVSGCDSFFNQQEDEPAETDEIVSVETEVSRVEDMAITKEYSGKIRPVSDIMIIPKMPGRVERVHVKVGQQVQKGDVLIELDGTEVELQVAQAQAAYRASKISVDSTKEKAQDLKADKKELSDSIKTIDEGIKEIDQGLGQVTKSMEELGQALQQGVITEKQYNASLEELNTNKAGLEEQRKGLTAQRAELAAMEKSLEGTIQSLPSDEQLDAQLEQAKAGLDLAKSAQDSLKLTSPIDGTVATLSVEEGEMASQAVPPVTVIDMSSLLLDVSVMEGDIMGIEEGQNMDVFIDALGTQPVTGIVHTVSPVPDQMTQAYPVTIKIENSSGIKPGMFARARLILSKKEKVLTISKAGIIREGGKTYVFVVQGNKAVKKEITVGLESDQRVEVISGIKSGDMVITKGQAYLEDGDQVQIVRGEK